MHDSARAAAGGRLTGARRSLTAAVAVATLLGGFAAGVSPASATEPVVPAPVVPTLDAVSLPPVDPAAGTAAGAVSDPAFALPTQYSVRAECVEGLIALPIVTLTPVANAGYPDAAGENYLGYLMIAVNGVVRGAGDVSGVLGQPKEFTTEGVSLYNGDLVEMTLSAAGKTISASATVSCSFQPSNERYVIRVYQDLFGRLPDDEGFETWVTLLDRGHPRAGVSNSITGSTEFRTVLLRGVYARFLGREPDPTGLGTWLGALAAGRTISQVEAGFLGSDEYWIAGGSTPAGWVQLLYADVLGRAAAPDEVTHWVDRLAKGTSRYDVSLGFLLSTENLTTEVNGYYGFLLGRAIDPTGRDSWVGRLQSGGRDEDIIGGIIASTEYFNRR